MSRKKYPLAPDDPVWTRIDKMLVESDAYYAEHPDELAAVIAAEEAALNWPSSEFEKYEARITTLEQQVHELTSRLDAAEAGK